MKTTGFINIFHFGKGFSAILFAAGVALPGTAWAGADADTDLADVAGTAIAGGADAADAAGAAADAEDQEGRTILVQARRKAVDPNALSTSPKASIASVYTLTQPDIEALSVTTPNELLRTIPGVSVADLGNGGIPNGIAIRGWSLTSDGLNVRTIIDSFPRNFVSGGNNNGSNDLNILIPEVLESIDVIKGPFDTRFSGNFAYGGVAVFTTADYVPTRASLSVGSFGRRRILGTYGYKSDDGRVQYYVALEGLHETGRRENNEQNKINFFTNLTLQLSPEDQLKVTGQLYSNHYGQPGYIRSVLIADGTISEKDASDPNAKGWRNSGTLTAELFHRADFNFDVNFYLERLETYRSIMRQDRSRLATYPQNIFLDKRWTLGGGFHPWVDFDVAGIEAIFRAGVETRADIASVDRFPGFNNVAVAQPSSLNGTTGFFSYSDFTIFNHSIYGELSLKPAEWLKLTGGVRNDWFVYDVESTTYVSSTNSLKFQHIKNTVNTPTLHAGLAITPFDGLTLLGNFGEGITSTNVHTQLPLNPELEPTKLNTKEVVLKYRSDSLGFSFEAGAYHTLNQGELGTDPSTGLTVNLGRSVRKGYDIAGRLRLYDHDGTTVQINGNYNEVNARLRNPATAGAVYVTSTPPWTATYGIDAVTPFSTEERVRLAVQHSFIGPIYLTTSGSLRSGSYNRLAVKLAYEKPNARNLRIWASGVAYNGDREAEMATTITVSGKTYRVTNAQPPFRFETGIAVDF